MMHRRLTTAGIEVGPHFQLLLIVLVLIVQLRGIYIRVFAKVRFKKTTYSKIVPKAIFAVHFFKTGKNVLYRW